MKSVYKYKLQIGGEQQIELPIDAEILTVQVQRGKLCLWALVDTESVVKVTHRFYVYGTGHNVHDDEHKKYIGTFQLADGDLVFHVFKEKQ